MNTLINGISLLQSNVIYKTKSRNAELATLMLSTSYYHLWIQPHLGLDFPFTAAVPPVLLNSGSERWATWRRADATHGSLPTGRSAVGLGRRCTASDGCRRCRRHLRRSGARGGWGWWCAPVCCFYSELRENKGAKLLLKGINKLTDSTWQLDKKRNCNGKLCVYILKLSIPDLLLR